METNCTRRKLLTLMVVGQSQVGKTSLVNSILCPDSSSYPRPTMRRIKTPFMEVNRAKFGEGAAELLLNVIDTPAVKRRTDWTHLLDLIEEEYEDHLNDDYRGYRDTFIHCCLYLITPTGEGLSPLDVEYMKDLCDKVNIIPVIAKSDNLTNEECAIVKKSVMRDIAKHKIRIYWIAEEYNKPIQKRMPFAVVSPNTVIEANRGVKRIKYPWGVTNISDRLREFFALREMLLNTHLQDLKYVTDLIHYGNFIHRTLFGFDIRVNVFTQDYWRARRNGTRQGEIGVTITVNLHENFFNEESTVNICLKKIHRIYKYMIEDNNCHKPTLVNVNIVNPFRRPFNL